MFSVKSWVWCAVVCLGVWGIGAAAMNVMVWHDAREVLRKHPESALSPKPLMDTKVADLSAGTSVERYGYTVQVPWSKVTAERPAKAITILTFTGDATMMVWDPSASIGGSSSRGQTPEEKAAMQATYGERALSSNYEFTSAQMQETGSEISLLNSRMVNLRAMMLLMLKPPVLKSTAIYSVSAGRLRGFQIGDPSVPGTIRLLLFDEKDRELQLWVRGPKSGPALTQEQINAILASIQPPA